MRVLNLSLDLFLDPISRWAGSGETRLSNDHYYAWKQETVAAFLEERCGLSQSTPARGRVVPEHAGAYQVWRELIGAGALVAPFDLVSLDAHTNLGASDRGWFYVSGRLLHLPLEKRLDADPKRMTPENYLLFAIAQRWLRSITLVTHPAWTDDVLPILYEDGDPQSGRIQLKRYDSRLLAQVIEYGMDPPEPTAVEPSVPFSVMGTGSYHETEPFDYVVFSRSANFTPKAADVLIPVIESCLLTE